MALVIVVAVIAMLTITVIEFTYNVQLDQHRVRNSLHALQAELMARSGVNLAEGFIGLDETPDVDTYTDEWLYVLSRFCSEQTLGEEGFTTHLRCGVRDESGKINVNLTRDPRGQPPGPETFTVSTILRDALRCMFEGQGIDVQIVDRLADYWQQDPAELPDGTQRDVPIFRSIEDFVSTFGIPSQYLGFLRRFLTAFPPSRMRGININTAPPEVLAAVLSAGADNPCASTPEVDDILERQLDPENPIKTQADIQSLMPQDDHKGQRARVFVSTSNIFALEASAVTSFATAEEGEVNGGGIGKTLSEVVYRNCDKGEAGKCQHWTLKPIDWQKEGGARLFREPDRLSELEQFYGGADAVDVGALFNR
jgi:type II secretory pathway component PulK